MPLSEGHSGQAKPIYDGRKCQPFVPLKPVMAQRKKPLRPPKRPPALALAKVLWGRGRFDEALGKFKEAVGQAPNDPLVLIDAGRAMAARHHVDRSMAFLERALRLSPRRPDVQHAVGETYLALGRPAEAEACFRRALVLAATPQSQFELAKICERRHALDEAAELVDRVLRAEPRSLAAQLLRARIERRRGEVDKARATLQRLIGLAEPSSPLLAEAYGELCTLLDGAGEYDKAWEAILRCKQIQLAREATAWQAAQFVLARCRRMMEAITKDHFDRWRLPDDVDSSQRLALLTGFPRSGTTLLEQVLDAHPEVISSEEKEVFSAEVFPWLGEGRPPDAPIEELLDELPPSRLLAARQMYMDAMQAMPGEPIAGRLHVDKNPATNLMIPPMRRIFPELKFIVALRDPRDVVLSCFLRYLPVNPVSVCFLTLERTADRYVLDMEAWLKMREMIDDWVEVRYEDAVTDLRREAERTLAALGLPWDDAVLEYRSRAKQRQVLSPTYEAVAKPLFTSSLGRWQNYQRHLAPVLDRLAPLVRAFEYKDEWRK